MDDSIRKMIDEGPLSQFSIYTIVQVQSLDLIGKEIIGLSKDWTDQITDFQRTYSLFWLWVLGAYEVIRVMDQHKHCFAAPIQLKIGVQKRRLAEIRMPFAKQEMRSSGEPVHAELSVVGFEGGMKFDISGITHSSTDVVEDFLMFIDSIKPLDIVAELPVGRPEQP